jgi:GNAT superfamily N-acetyltransferase
MVTRHSCAPIRLVEDSLMAPLSVSHPLARLLNDAALGRFPQPDGTVAVMPAPPGPADAVVAFTAHTVVAADVSPAEVADRLDSSDLGAPMNALFLHWLSGRLSTEPGSFDAVFATVGVEHAPALELLPDAQLRGHPRAVRAARYRTDVSLFADPDERAIVAVGRGLAGRWEAGFEVDPLHRNGGLGRSIVAAIRTLVRPGEPIFLQVAPGNAASVRAIIAGGFAPIGAEVLFVRNQREGRD